MSGGFFRGTTADQDTRFSNKHAKLLKSHKFPPELEHLDREAVDVKAANLDTHSRRRTKFSSKWSADDKGTDEKNGSKETVRISRSPRPADRSMSPPRGTRSRSVSKSFSNSRSHSRSRSLSASSKASRRSVSVERRPRSVSRRSSTLRRVGSRRRSLSPAPLHRQSPSPARRRLRSPSPAPSHGRSPSPARRRLQSPAPRYTLQIG
ncbi:hypothetical protein HanXRQr2_Chr08g0360911 [Helianthus annuus]|uniref:Uncharacterized protein n=1 Tax=Helianthus annuus TaxID=4232 RepID=A0A9K3IIT9_HELAN|nr:hypothetical protein HanXRQr2_Chr08g0360911 [Helianthus annuus]KAJ0903360.1 hypothetical protein HanPSC8_Chr08g0348171 [Helianthus annuus]